MAEQPKRAPLPTILVRGGTTSSSQDRNWAKSRADAEARRAYDDQMIAAAKAKAGLTAGPKGVEVNGMQTRQLSPMSPKLVLYYVKTDQDCICEISHLPHPSDPTKLDMFFVFVCPRCIAMGRPQDSSQILVRESHRKFHIDQRKAGPKRVTAMGVSTVVLVAGEVTVDSILRCDAEGCGWACQIAESRVMER
jgi:hypothetical protein